MADAGEYLISCGKSGEFGRYRPTSSQDLRRGDRVVVRSHRGVEFGLVMCAALPEHARYLSRTAVGEVLRLATAKDDEAAGRVQQQGDLLFAEARRLSLELGLPLEILDVDILLDGRQAHLYFLSGSDCDYRPLVSTLSRRHDIMLTMENLADPKLPGCGKPGCGQANGGGGCDSCNSGGGCGTCGKSTKKDDVAALLVELRQKMENHARTSLL